MNAVEIIILGLLLIIKNVIVLLYETILVIDKE